MGARFVHPIRESVVVVVNLSHKSHQAYRVGFPMGSNWRVRFNSDSNQYSTYSSNTTCNTANAAPSSRAQYNQAGARFLYRGCEMDFKAKA
jgi:1,4-alpha-glucan branching enzyme